MTHRPPLDVSDHAVLRELERAHGIPVEALRTAIAAKTHAARAMGACGLVADGLRYVIRDGIVVTVIDGTRSAAAEARQRGGGDD